MANELINRLAEEVSNELYLRLLGDDDILNFSARGRALKGDDVQAVRDALTVVGYKEIESWVAREGMSWLSGGLVSVSMKIQRADR